LPGFTRCAPTRSIRLSEWRSKAAISTTRCSFGSIPVVSTSKMRMIGLDNAPSDLRIGDPLAVWKLQYRYLGLSGCELAACCLVQSRQPATGIIVIDIPAVLDDADAIDNLPGLIKFKRYFGQAVEIAVWIGAHREYNLCFGEPYLGRRFHRKRSLALFSDTSLIQGSHASS